MKRLRSIMAIVITMVLVLSAMPKPAFADEMCDVHIPGGDRTAGVQYPCQGGYAQDYYWCDVCGFACYEDGTTAQWVERTEAHQFGDVHHTEDEVRSCTGWYLEDYYACDVCGECMTITVEGDTTYYDWPDFGVDWDDPALRHSPGSDQFEPSGTVCGGGITETHCYCTECGNACRVDGTHLYPNEIAETGHTPNLEEPRDANYLACTGGYMETWYPCKVCSTHCDAEGNWVHYQPADGEHVFGDIHLAEDEVHYCDGWYKEDYYLCSICNKAYVQYTAGEFTYWENAQWTWWEDREDPTSAKHYPSGELNSSEGSCGGGYAQDYYYCKNCGYACNADGDGLLPTGVSETGHTPDDRMNDADWTACGGGYKEAYSYCQDCGNACNAEGQLVHYYESPTYGESGHTPNPDSVREPDWLPCTGGYKDAIYRCIDCGHPCDANGEGIIEWSEPTSDHKLGQLHLAADEIHHCNGWYTEDYYICEYCGGAFASRGEGNDTWWECIDRYWPNDGEDVVHNLTDEVIKADYTDCGGGFKVDRYYCEDCGRACTADGGQAQWQEPISEEHKPFLAFPIDLYKNHCNYIIGTYYLCMDCMAGCDADGKLVQPEERPEPLEHQWVLKKASEAVKNNCNGWYTVDYYECSGCHTTAGVGTDGKPDFDVEFYEYYQWQEDESLQVHGDLVHYPATTGYQEFWVCWECGNLYFDANGKNEVEKMRDLEDWVTEDVLENVTVSGTSDNSAQAPQVQDEKELVEATLTEEEKEQISQGASVTIKVEANYETEAVSEEDLEIITQAGKDEGITVELVLDLSLYVSVGDEDPRKVTELRKPTTFTLPIPADLQNADRIFYIVHVHNGESQILEDLDNDPATITFQMDSFSAVALAYSEDTPSYGDESNILLMTGILVLSAAALAVTVLGKKYVF